MGSNIIFTSRPPLSVEAREFFEGLKTQEEKVVFLRRILELRNNFSELAEFKDNEEEGLDFYFGARWHEAVLFLVQQPPPIFTLDPANRVLRCWHASFGMVGSGTQHVFEDDAETYFFELRQIEAPTSSTLLDIARELTRGMVLWNSPHGKLWAGYEHVVLQ